MGNGRLMRKSRGLKLKLKPNEAVVLPTTATAEPSPSQISGLVSGSHISTSFVLQISVLLLALLLVVVVAVVAGVAAQAYFVASGRLILDVAHNAYDGAGRIRSERVAEGFVGQGSSAAGSETTPTVMPALPQAPAPAQASAPGQAPAPMPAAEGAPVPAQAPAPGPTPAPAMEEVVLIPDRLLVFGPQHNRTGDWGVGLGHTLASQSCAAAVAFALNRTLVVHRYMYLPGIHIREPKSRLAPREVYFELGSENSKGLHIVYEDEVQHDVIDQLLQLPKDHGDEIFMTSAPGNKHSMQMVKKTLPLQQASKSHAKILAVELHFYEYAFEVCSATRNEEYLKERGIFHKNMVFDFLPVKKTYVKIADQIAESLGTFTAVHVRRGDKAAWKERYPHLDYDTQPEQLLKTLPKYASPGSTIYIGSNEPSSFFSPLKEVYKVYFAEDFSHLWAPGSFWFNTTRAILGENPRFDSFMLAAVDYTVFDRAFRCVETFNDLTSDPS